MAQSDVKRRQSQGRGRLTGKRPMTGDARSCEGSGGGSLPEKPVIPSKEWVLPPKSKDEMLGSCAARH